MDQFRIEFPDAALDALRARLAATRWPLDPGNDRWQYGVPRPWLEDLVDYWQDGTTGAPTKQP